MPSTVVAGHKNRRRSVLARPRDRRRSVTTRPETRLVVALAMSLVWPAAQITSGHTASSGDRSQQQELRLQDYYRLHTIDEPAMSPDGHRVAFTRTWTVESENRRTSEIWLANSDGSGEPTRLTHPAFSSSSPRFSADGRLLAFVSERPGPDPDRRTESSIWFLRMDSAGEAFQIPGVDGDPIFSPDNRWIAFTKPTPPETAVATSSDFERLLAGRFDGHLYDWMNYRFDRRGYLPDPRDPRATPPRELYIVPRDGGSARQLTRLGINVEAAAWRPDSGALVLTADSQQRDEHTYERADLWIVDLDADTRRLTDDGYHHAAPAWSADGQAIVFRRHEGLDMVIAQRRSSGAAVDLFRMPAAGGEPENLTASWDLRPGAPTSATDGGVYFSARIGGERHLFRVAPESHTVEQVTDGPRQLSDFSFAAGFDRMAYVGTRPTRPGEVFAARYAGDGEIKLSGFNDALVGELRLRPAERIRYPSKDGTEVEGWIILPGADRQQAGRAPLILSIHGGPHGAYGESFSFQFQLWASQGYAVLYTNPRGSAGYGEDFLWATWAGWGNLDTEDVMAGVDHALQLHPLDDNRLGVSGYSYGGFLTNWVIAHSSRFQAAISGAGISNWLSDYGTADIPRTKESEFYGPPWEADSGALLWDQSPVQYAGNVTTPTLFIHGESDYRVPIEQGEQMYTALRKRQVPARFVRYPNMAHGGWTPWNMVHRYYQGLRWWEEHLR